MKDGILGSLNQQVIQYDEDTRRFDQQRLLPGWNYCQYFVMKVRPLNTPVQTYSCELKRCPLLRSQKMQEGLASIFELMQLFDEALVQYDELEASFFQTLAGAYFPRRICSPIFRICCRAGSSMVCEIWRHGPRRRQRGYLELTEESISRHDSAEHCLYL